MPCPQPGPTPDVTPEPTPDTHIDVDAATVIPDTIGQEAAFPWLLAIVVGFAGAGISLFVGLRRETK